MIEAVSSVVLNAPLLRGNVEQNASSRASDNVAFEAAEGVSGPQAPFVSPYIHVDVNFDKAVLQIRDSDTGDVLSQFPSKSRLQLLREQAAEAELAAQAAEPQTSRGDSAPVSRFSAGSAVAVQEQSSANDTGASSAPSVAQAQVASTALNVQAQSVETQSTNVSVTA